MKQNNVTFGKRKIATESSAKLTTKQLVNNAINKLYLGDERRGSKRRKTLKACKLVFNNRFSVYDGVMINLSQSGAMIKVKNSGFIANEFLLNTVYGQSEFLCSVRWRGGEFVGVKFEKF